MKTSVNMPENLTNSIMQRIIDGSMSIDSVDEFREIIEAYPKDPFLLRKFGDLLAEQKQIDESLQIYDRAAHLFVEEGMILQAVVAKILAWSLRKPTHGQGRRFHAILNARGTRNTPLQRFWAGMTYAQLVSVMLRLVRVRLPSGRKIIETGAPADAVYFVVSGTLAEMPAASETAFLRKGTEPEPRLIGHNDIFGEIFPLNAPTLSSFETRSVSDVELIKISKKALREVCRRHPRVEKLLFNLYKSDNRDHGERSWQTVRRAIRCGIPTRIDLVIQIPRQERYTCIAVDLSVGGLCADLGLALDTRGGSDYKGKRVRVSMDLLDGNQPLIMMGKIIWHRLHTVPDGARSLIGIRFDPLGGRDQERLMDYCRGGAGEQDLLWALWDNLVRTENSMEGSREPDKQ